MIRYKYYLLSILVITLSCCNNQEKKTEGHNFPTIKFEIDDCFENKISTRFQIDKIIPLETSSECLLQRISTVRINNNEILVFDRSSENLFRFNWDGKMISKVGAKGKGPNEYLKLTDYWASKCHDSIIVYDGTRNNLYFYSRDNSLFNKISVPSCFKNFSFWKSKQLILFGRNNTRFPKGDRIPTFCVYNLQGKNLFEKLFYNHNELAQMDYLKFNSLFTLPSGEINIYNYLIDTVFSYNGKVIEPRFYLDVSPYNLGYDEKIKILNDSRGDYRKINKLLAEKRFLINNRSIWLETKDFIYTNMYSSKRTSMYHLLVNKENLNGIAYNFMSQDFIWRVLKTPIGYADNNNESYLVFILKASSLHVLNGKYKKEFNEFKNKYPEQAELFEEAMKKVNKNDNPCLVFAKYKRNE